MAAPGQRFDDWVRRYLRAWNSNEPADIENLFAPDASYYTEPHRKPWVGVGEITEKWIERKDEPGDTSFAYEVLAVDGDLGVVRARTDYKSSGNSYSNLWLVRLDEEDRCLEFTEYWMQIDDD